MIGDIPNLSLNSSGGGWYSGGLEFTDEDDSRGIEAQTRAPLGLCRDLHCDGVWSRLAAAVYRPNGLVRQK